MRHPTLPVVTESHWTASATPEDRLAIRQKITQMVNANQTDGTVESDTWPPPANGYRYWIDTAAAQEFIDFCTANSFQGYAGTEIINGPGPFADVAPPYIIPNSDIVVPTNP